MTDDINFLKVVHYDLLHCVDWSRFDIVSKSAIRCFDIASLKFVAFFVAAFGSMDCCILFIAVAGNIICSGQFVMCPILQASNLVNYD